MPKIRKLRNEKKRTEKEKTRVQIQGVFISISE